MLKRNQTILKKFKEVEKEEVRKMKVFLEESDIEFFNGNRVKREVIDKKVLPAIKELMIKRGIDTENCLEIYCPRCKRKMFFVGKDGYIFTYGCKSFGCYPEISISTFPIKL